MSWTVGLDIVTLVFVVFGAGIFYWRLERIGRKVRSTMEEVHQITLDIEAQARGHRHALRNLAAVLRLRGLLPPEELPFEKTEVELEPPPE